MGDKPKLLEQVHEAMRARHYSRRTEEAYVQWIKRFIFFHDKRHPASMGGEEVNAFLSWLATERNVSASRKIKRSARYSSSTDTCSTIRCRG